MKNRVALRYKPKVPTTASPKDHDKKLCSKSGIQSRESPKAPKVMTAIVPQNPCFENQTENEEQRLKFF